MKKFELYRHNLEAYEDVVSAFDAGQNIASIVQATGTGKTFIAINLAKDVFPKKMLFVAPTLAIIEHVQEIISEYGLADIVNIEFATYQSFVNKSQKDLENMEFDYLVVDEFHHTGAPIWGQRITDLINSHKSAFVLGMSAYTIRDKGTCYAMDVAPTIVQKMTDDSVNEAEELPIFADSIVHRYDLADALIDGVLKEPQYKFSKIKLYGYARSLQEKINNGSLTKEEKNNYKKELDGIMANLVLSDEVQQILRENIKPNSKCIYFVPIGKTDGVRNIENAKAELQKIFPDAIIYSTTSDDPMGAENREAFYKDVDLDGNDVSGKLRIMVAINQYNEGVHAEGVDTVIMGRATQSDIVFYEQLGRALSVTNSSTPLCIDLSGNLDFILDLSEEIGDRIRKHYEATGKHARLNRNMPTFTFSVDNEDVKLLASLQEIEDKTETWLVRFEQLKKYLEDNNRKYPSSENNNEEIRSLGKWVERQRTLCRNGKLSESRIKALESINFIFNYKDNNWNERFVQLKNYLVRNGEYPNSEDKNENIKKLGIWAQRQRENYKKGALSESRIKALQSINFIFEPKDNNWYEQFNQLKLYLKEHDGKYPSSEDKNENVKKLGKWVERQRTLCRNGKLSESRIKTLESINFVFDYKDNNWNEQFNQFKKYLDAHNGEYPGLEDNDENVRKLFMWVNHQRQNYKNGLLSETKIKALESINFIFDPQDYAWDGQFNQLKKYLNKHNGRYPSYADYDENIRKLAIWVSAQRQKYKKGKLSERRIKALESIEFDFDPRGKYIKSI